MQDRHARGLSDEVKASLRGCETPEEIVALLAIVLAYRLV